MKRILKGAKILQDDCTGKLFVDNGQEALPLSSESYSEEHKLNPKFVDGAVPYETRETEILLPETTLQFAYNEELGMMVHFIPGVDEDFFATSATVVWDGVTYNTKALEGDVGFYFGNTGLILGAPTEEPFIVEVNVSEGYMALIALDDSESHTVSISVENEVIKTLDPKYLSIIDLGEITDDDTELPEKVASQLEEAFNRGKPVLVRYNVPQHHTPGSETLVDLLTFYDSSIPPSTQKFVGPVHDLRLGSGLVASYDGISLSGYYLEVTRVADHTWVSRIGLIDNTVPIRSERPCYLSSVLCSYVSADGNTHASDLDTVIRFGIADTTKHTRIHVLLYETDLYSFLHMFLEPTARYLYAIRLVLDNERAYSYAFSTFGSILVSAGAGKKRGDIPKTLRFSTNVVQGGVSKRIDVTIVADVEDGCLMGAYVYIDCIVPEYTDYVPDAASV